MKKIISIFVMALLCAFCLVACEDNKKPDPNEGEPAVEPGEDLPTELANAKSYIKQMYENAPTVTASDYQRVASYKNITLAWSVNVSDDKVKVIIEEGKTTVTIKVKEDSEEDIPYELKVVLSDSEGNKTELKWNYTVPKFEYLTWEQYLAIENGKAVAVKGIVTAIIGRANGNSNNCLYVQDLENKGAYYGYNGATDPSAADSGIKLGMTVEIKGTKDIYSGTHEIKDPVWKVLDTTITEIQPIDYTEKFTSAESLKDESLVAAQGLLVTVKGVTIDEISGTDKSYYQFKLANKTSYVRISSSVCPLSKTEQEAFKAGFTAHIGWTADATGVICVYDGNFYLTPVAANAFEYKSLPVLDDAGMVAFEKDKLALDAEITEPKEVELPAAGPSYGAVAITWTSDNETLAKIEEGKVVFAEAEEDTEITLTATLTAGEVSDTKEIKVKLIAPVSDLLEVEVVEKAFALAEGKAMNGKQVLAGTIVSIDTAYSTEFKNITVTIKPDVAKDDEHNIQCYRLAGGEDLAVGDKIVVTGVIKNFRGTVEFDAKCTYSKTMTVEEAKALVVVADAFALAEGKALKGKKVLAGTIVTIDTAYSTEFKNITVTIKPDGVTDDEHNIQCYRLAGGEDLAVGDKIVVSGIIKNFRGTVEFDAKCTYSKTLTVAEAKGLVVVEEAFALAEGKAMKAKSQLTGTIVSIDTAYSTEFKNITVTIKVDGVTDDDHNIQCYRLAGGEDLAVGDHITVTGLIKNFRGTVEFDAKCTYVKIAEPVGE